jgi:7-cyano-7-deazaguanine synthase in queuosine biosynthesis
MPQSPPHIVLDKEGVCNLCRAYKKTDSTSTPVSGQHETDLVKILNKHRGKHKYDCLVMLSGGKDSTSSLYYMKKRYRLNPLAFTFDHGFESDEAMNNIKKAVEILDVDFLYYRTNFMKRIFRLIQSTGSKAVMCHLCSIWYMQLTYETAKKYKTPIIVAGWTKGQTNVDNDTRYADNAAEYLKMSSHTVNFIKEHVRKIPEYKNFPLSMNEVIKKAGFFNKPQIISPHWFLPYDTGEYTKTIIDELSWKYPVLSYPGKSTNCLLNFLSVYYSMKNYGYTHYHVEMSKLIRAGAMTREEAFKELEINFTGQNLKDIQTRLDYAGL